jgi:lipopolysaccharide transport system ATP-binding protein
MSAIINVELLSKLYKIGATRSVWPSLRETLASRASDVLSRLATRPSAAPPVPAEVDFWALKNVSFSVARGEAIGIVGRNGAGKSTLLKILSRITEPTSGRVRLRGRVASLLEVGTGFHQDLTGRENIILNGAILGMARNEVLRKFDEIVAFAEVEAFVDTPVKHFSSGMYMRLAFAVAAHLEPEILIVDEVLAVGDAAFQRKCLGKMKDISGKGRTVLFVSHNLLAVQGLCQRALLLDRGHLVLSGTAEEVTSAYSADDLLPRLERRWDEPARAPGSGGLSLRAARVSRDDPSSEPITVRSPVRLEFDLSVQIAGEYHLSLYFFNEQSALLFNSFATPEDPGQGTLEPGSYRVSCVVPGDLLNSGSIRVDVIGVRDRGTQLFHDESTIVFDVVDVPDLRGGWFGSWTGAVRPRLRWETRPLQPVALVRPANSQ